MVRCTGSFAEIDFGSALAMVSVYKSENLGSLEETSKPVLVKDPCKKKRNKIQVIIDDTQIQFYKTKHQKLSIVYVLNFC